MNDTFTILGTWICLWIETDGSVGMDDMEEAKDVWYEDWKGVDEKFTCT